MAKQGEGDPRWVVRERQDGRNVNGWHWEDKDVTSWAETRLKQLITYETCRAEIPEPGVHVVSLDSVDGDATLYNRKGVLKVLYDLKLAGKWSSRHTNEDERTTGSFRIELFDDEPEIICTIDDKSKKSDNSFRQSFQTKISPVISQHCRTFIAELYKGADQFIDGMTVQSKADNAKKTVTSSRTHISSSKPSSNNSVSSPDDILIEEAFVCSASDWMRVFTDVPRLSALTRSKAVIDAKPGGRWEIMNGTASGTFQSIETEAITLNWKLRSWGDQASHAAVSLAVTEPEKGRTKATIRIAGFPKGKESETEGFWRIQILQAMRVLFGWGDASKFMNM